MDALAEAELDDAEDFVEKEASPKLDSLLKERGSVQLSSIQEPVMVRSWPIGLAMASAPSITVSLTATGFQRIMSMMACLKIPFRHGQYKVNTNQFDQGVASIRAQPRVRDASTYGYLQLFQEKYSLLSSMTCCQLYYIYIYAFSRRFYPKRLTVHSGYTLFYQYVFPGNRTHNLCAVNTMLYHWATGTLKLLVVFICS